MQEVFTHGRARVGNYTLQVTLREAGCSSAVRTLLEAS